MSRTRHFKKHQVQDIYAEFVEQPKKRLSAPVRLSDEHEDYMVEFLRSHEAVWSKDRSFQDVKQIDKVNILEEAAEHVGRTGQYNVILMFFIVVVKIRKKW